MDRLRAVVDTIVGQLPTCAICCANLCQAYVSRFYTCEHFVCTRCATEMTEKCQVCEEGIHVAVDLEIVGKQQWVLADSLNCFYSEGRRGVFEEICREFHHLCACLAGEAEKQDEQPLRSQEAQIEPATPPPHSPLGHTGLWTCPRCFTSNPSEFASCSHCPLVNFDIISSIGETELWECPCGATNPLAQTTCPYHRSHNEAPHITKLVLWPCSCGYQYNLEDALTCGKCGKKRRSAVKGESHRVISTELRRCGECEAEVSGEVCKKCEVRQGNGKKVEEIWQCEECGFMRNTTDVCENCERRRDGEKRQANEEGEEIEKKRRLE